MLTRMFQVLLHTVLRAGHTCGIGGNEAVGSSGAWGRLREVSCWKGRASSPSLLKSAHSC